jgi:acyl-CoA reductase-like NAD-dependent aldehyde dehydrogenase
MLKHLVNNKKVTIGFAPFNNPNWIESFLITPALNAGVIVCIYGLYL